MLRVLIVIVSIALFATGAFAESDLLQTVEIDCKNNCAIFGSRKWQDKAKEIKLPAGTYKLIPKSGGCSPWAKDGSANDRGQQPWMWNMLISANGKRYELGSQAKYETPNKAFEEQRYEEVVIALESESILRVGIEDIWRDKGYCSDNRGREEMEIYKVNSNHK